MAKLFQLWSGQIGLNRITLGCDRSFEKEREADLRKMDQDGNAKHALLE